MRSPDLVLGMADIVPEYAAVIDSRQLSRWYEHAQRDLPWRRAGRDAVADPGQRVHAAADAGGARRTDLADVGGPLADTVRDRRRQRRGCAAGLGQSSVIHDGPSGCTNARR